jgi:D-alanyl-lipoteichoic acid acyltransferase DltB (MBOAT superfamily)
MLFNSLTFVVFFVVVLVAYRVIPGWRAKKGMLLAASYLFYGAWNPPFVALLAISTVVDWLVAARMAKTQVGRMRRALLIVSLAVNLGFLGYFKYGSFLLANFVALMSAAGVAYQPAASDIVLPVGISFYTFQTLSYTIDVYRGRMEPSRSFLDFALFVSFFPQLVAGPIVRAADFLPQCFEEKKTEARALGFGLFLMTLGLFEKVVIADGMLAPAADQVFGSPGPASAFDTWLGVLAFAGQIFCDFAGYSTCAIGAALCLGFQLPTNFRFPYAAIGFRDFWRRWHISLSSWLRDYLYIPLGGNRHGRRRMLLALMVTMLLGGLWHGASWRFVVWGGLHGLFLVVERALSKRFGDRPWVATKPARFALGALTFVLVLLTWVFFRATDLPRAMMHVAAMLGAIGAAPILKTIEVVKVVAVMSGLLAFHVALRGRSVESVSRGASRPLLAFFWFVMLTTIVLMQGSGDAFIYFQF